MVGKCLGLDSGNRTGSNFLFFFLITLDVAQESAGLVPPLAWICHSIPIDGDGSAGESSYCQNDSVCFRLCAHAALHRHIYFPFPFKNLIVVRIILSISVNRLLFGALKKKTAAIFSVQLSSIIRFYYLAATHHFLTIGFKFWMVTII